MDVEELRTLKRRSETDPEAVVKNRETLYDALAESGRLAFGGHNPFEGFADDEATATGKRVAAAALANVVAHDATVAEECARNVLAGDLAWSDHTESVLEAVRASHPKLVESVVGETLEAVTATDRNWTDRNRLGTLRTATELDADLLIPHVEAVEPALDDDRRPVRAAAVELLGEVIGTEFPDRESVAGTLTAALTADEGRPDARLRREVFEALTNAPPAVVPDTDAAVAIALDLVADPDVDESVHATVYLRHVAYHTPDRLAPEVFDHLASARAPAAVDPLLDVVAAAAEGGALPDPDPDLVGPLADFLEYGREDLTRGVANVVGAVAETDATLVADLGPALGDALARAVDDDLSEPANQNPAEQLRAVSRDAVTTVVLEALQAVADDHVDAVVDAVPAAARQLADPEAADVGTDLEETDDVRALVEEIADRGPPSWQFLATVTEDRPAVVFEALLEDVLGRESISRHQASVLVDAAEAAPEVAANRLDDVLALAALDGRHHPAPAVVQSAAEADPATVASPEVVDRLVSGMADGEVYAVGYSAALLEVDPSVLKPHLDIIRAYVADGTLEQNGPLLLVRATWADVEGSTDAIRELAGTLFELVGRDEVTVRRAACFCLPVLAADDPAAFERQVPRLLVALETDDETVRELTLETLWELVDEYADVIALATPQLLDACQDGDRPASDLAGGILTRVCGRDDISKVETAARRADAGHARANLEAVVRVIDEEPAGG